ncbi:MAG TPA: type II secretion system F family protein [Candidatus Dormibacteraeota bacterium]|jgi:tight adherence protein B|nr:type II secretion system F family protein [Candidatus Dormibacteraeota bacterium]
MTALAMLPADLPTVAGFNLGSLLLAVIAGLAVMLVVFGLSAGKGEVDDITRRLERYAEIGEPAESRERRPASPRELLDRFTDALNLVLARSARTDHLTEDLARADLKLKSSEWVLGVLGAGVAVGLLATLRFGTVLAFLPSPVAVWFISGFVLRFLQARRKRAFDKQLGDTIILLSNALKAGYSFAQAVSTVSKSANPPIADEFSRATREMALGISVDDALNHMVKRNVSEDFDLMVTAVQIHRVVGGNLAEILDTIAHTIRERVRIKGEISSLTAQARASGWIITALPICLAMMLTVISPDYFNPMFHQTLGIVMLAIGGFSMAVGFAIIQKIVKIEV